MNELPQIIIRGRDFNLCRAFAGLVSGACEVYNIKHEIVGAGWMEHEEQEAALDLFQDVTIETAVQLVVEETPPDVWAEDAEWLRSEWKFAVTQGDTNLGYWDWVSHQREADPKE